MHPFVNPKRGLIFWWSAKCGCTTVKSIMIESMVFDHLAGKVDADEAAVVASLDRILYRRLGSDGSEIDVSVSEFLDRNYIRSVHCPMAGSLTRIDLNQASRLRNILFMRNPFHRFVSGVVDKHIEGNFSKIYSPMSFRSAAENMHMLEPHHFMPQIGGAFLPGLKYDRVFDIGEIDFGYLSEALGMRVEPRKLHSRRGYSLPCVPNLASMNYRELASLKAAGDMPEYDCFYDDRSRELVRTRYSNDFAFMRRWLPASVS